MPLPIRRQHSHGQSGAITILVCLMLLVLLTISALGLSRNSLRSTIASGTLREVHQTENAADAGLEWSVYWMGQDTNNPPKRPVPASGALAIQNQMLAMQAAANFGSPGTTLTAAAYPEFQVGTTASATISYDVTLNLMGQTQPFYQGQSAGASSPTAPSATTLNLWSVTVDGYVTYANGTSFAHRRQVWVTLPPS
jgi:Tfp pilus assembly protein PilX